MPALASAAEPHGHRVGWALVSPAAILIGIFGLLPVLMSLQLSFQKSDLLSHETPWVGFDNYKKLADDPVFVEAIKHTIVYTALFVPGTMLVGLFIAAALNRSVRFISVYRTAAYITMAVSTISQGIIFLWLTDRDYGLVNAALNAVGVAVAAVPGVAVAGAVRHRGDDDLGLDRILGDRVSGCAAGCSRRAARGGRDRRGVGVHPVPHHHRAAARARRTCSCWSG